MTKKYPEILAGRESRIASPDGNITVTLAGGAVVDAGFATGSYSRYTESALEHQLVAVIKLVLVARARARAGALTEALGRDALPGGPGSPSGEYAERLDALTVESGSPRITLLARPNGFWEVEIRDDSLRETSGDEFIDEFLGVAGAAVSSLRVQIQRLKREVHGRGPVPTGFHG